MYVNIYKKEKIDQGNSRNVFKIMVCFFQPS